MFQPWRIKLREVEEAIKSGRLDDASRLLLDGDLRQYYPAQKLIARLAGEIIDRGRTRVAKGETSAGWHDLEAAEKLYVRRRDRGCVVRHLSPCDGPLDVDHVRASGGLGMKSPTHRTNLVVLCRWHHRLKTEYGKTWRPILLDYLARVEPAVSEGHL